jgi:hypothetical protein
MQLPLCRPVPPCAGTELVPYSSAHRRSYARVTKGKSSFEFALLIIGFGSMASLALAAQKVETPVSSEARAALIQMLDAVGGRDVWSPMHSSVVSGTERADDASSPDETPFRWVDSWPNGVSRGRNIEKVKGDRPASGETPMSPSRPAVQSKFDPVAQLIVHLPGVAILQALGDQYDISPRPAPAFKAGLQCIRIRRMIEDRDARGLDLTLCADSTTHLPKLAFLAGSGPSSTARPLYEEIRFLEYQSVQGRIVPKEISISTALGQKSRLHLAEVSLSQAKVGSEAQGGAR